MPTTLFLTELDDRARVRGSRDPLGARPLWDEFGRGLIGNLSTVSNSVRDFKVLLLGYWFVGRIAPLEDPRTSLIVFLYLTPIMTRLRDRQVVSVWGSKSHGAQSSVQIERAVVATGDLQGWSFAQARPVGSASSSHWKESLRDQIAAQVVQAPPGALEMQVGFRVGPGRAWANLWKQTIDAFGPVLGVQDPARPFHPQDGRIVRLGLHQTLDAAMGHDVGIALWWRQAEGVVDRGP